MTKWLFCAHRSLRALRLVEMTVESVRLVEMTGGGYILLLTSNARPYERQCILFGRWEQAPTLRSGNHSLCHFDRGLPSGEIYAPNSTLSCHFERSEESSLVRANYIG